MDYTSIAAAFLIYIIAAYIHVNHTGYALAWFKGSRLYNSDIKSFRTQNTCRATINRKQLKNLENFAMAPKVGNHTLQLEAIPGVQGQTYVLTAFGLLLDREIEEFVNQLTDPEAKREFVLKAMELQLDFLPA